jgi:hypothetical protein
MLSSLSPAKRLSLGRSRTIYNTRISEPFACLRLQFRTRGTRPHTHWLVDLGRGDPNISENSTLRSWRTLAHHMRDSRVLGVCFVFRTACKFNSMCISRLGGNPIAWLDTRGRIVSQCSTSRGLRCCRASPSRSHRLFKDHRPLKYMGLGEQRLIGSTLVFITRATIENSHK